MAEIELALWMYSPLSEYKLNDAKTAVAEWRDQVVPEPTAMQLANAEAAYDALTVEGAVALEVSVLPATITGDGVDEAVVTVTSHVPYPDFVTLYYNGVELELALDPYTPGSFESRTATQAFTSATAGSTIEVSLPETWQGLSTGESVVIEVT